MTFPSFSSYLSNRKVTMIESHNSLFIQVIPASCISGIGCLLHNIGQHNSSNGQPDNEAKD